MQKNPKEKLIDSLIKRRKNLQKRITVLQQEFYDDKKACDEKIDLINIQLKALSRK